MIIYGSRMYGRQDLVKGWGTCDFCGSYNKQKSYGGRKWGHLYFIPLIPMGSRVRVLRECSACSMGTHLDEMRVTEYHQNIRGLSDAALSAIMNDEKEFTYEGDVINSVPGLASLVDALYALNEPDYVRLAVESLKEKDKPYAYHMVNGHVLEFHGKLDEAAAEYEEAIRLEPEEAAPLLYFGHMLLLKKKTAEARPVYEKALALSTDRLPVLNVLIDIYDKLRDYEAAADCYEECFELVPESKQDKKVFKKYQKACKQAGRNPVAR